MTYEKALMPFFDLLPIEMRVLQEQLNFVFGQLCRALLRFRCIRSHRFRLLLVRMIVEVMKWVYADVLLSLCQRSSCW